MNAVVEQRQQGIVVWAAQEYGVDPGKVMAVLKNTCFKTGVNEPEATDAEVAGLLVVAKAHNLNPFLREIFAFKDKKGGVVPVVGVDGWARVINDHKALDGIEFEFDSEGAAPKWCKCSIYRKDRTRPTSVTEFMEECKRDTQPWRSHPRRMLRHKALIQCARIAFSFSGIYDEDEAERIVEREINPAPEPVALPNRSAGARLAAAVGAGKPPETVVEAEPDLGTLIAEARTGLAACESEETVGLYADALPDAVRGSEEVAKAVRDRLVAIKASGQEDPPPAVATAGKRAGTPRLRKQYVEKLAACVDSDTLDVLYDETRGFVWGAEDQSALTAAYEAQKGKIAK